jgi:hypothetical protein
MINPRKVVAEAGVVHVQVPTVLNATTVNAPLVVTSGVHSAACADGIKKLAASKSKPEMKA